MNFYQQVQIRPKEIIDIMNGFPTDKDTYNQIRSAKYQAPLKRALRYFYLNKTCYSGLMRYNSKGEFNTPYGNYPNPSFEISQEQIGLLKRTEIYNLDYKEIPYIYKPNDFVFIDCPYIETWKGYGDILFDDNCQRELQKWFLNNPAQVMIIINKVDLTVELYERYIKEEYQVKYGIDVKSGNKKIKTHLIITNY